MGDAKRKRQAEAVEEQVAKALEANSISQQPPPGTDCVQALIIALDHAEIARVVLGGLPALCERYLQHAADLKSTADHGEGPDAVYWERWPSGRQSANLMRSLEPVQTEFLSEVYLNAGVRGYRYRLAAFPSKGWAEIFHKVHADHARHVQEIADLIVEAPRVVLSTPLPGYTAITVPKIESARLRSGMVAQMLRMLDEMAASRDSLSRTYQSLRFSFEGYDDDPREVWDVEHNVFFLRRLAKHAPWWPWLMAPEQAVIWLGALIADGPAVVVKSLNVAFPIQDEVAQALIDSATQATIQALDVAGFDLSSGDTKQKIASAMLRLSGTVRGISQLTTGLESGSVERASDDDLRLLHESLQQVDEGADDTDSLRLQLAIALDRSEQGCTILKILDSKHSDLLPDSVRGELHNWALAGGPLAVVSGFADDENSWVFQSSGTEETELQSLVDVVTSAAKGAGAAIAWTLGVGSSLAERLTKCVSEAAKRHGLPSDTASTGMPHHGLLNLAIEPGGQEVDFDKVQIQDAGIFTKVTELELGPFIEKLSEMRKGNVTDRALEAEAQAHNVRAWQRDDGSLLIREIHPPYREVVATSGAWRLLDDAEMTQISRDLEHGAAQLAPDGFLARLANTLNESSGTVRRQREAYEEAVAKATSIVGLFGRETRSLSVLRGAIGNHAGAMDTADRWLQSDSAYFLFWRTMDGEAAAIIADDEDQLLSESLSDALNLGKSPQKILLLPHTDTHIDERARSWWIQHGGLVVRQASGGH